MRTVTSEWGEIALHTASVPVAPWRRCAAFAPSFVCREAGGPLSILCWNSVVHRSQRFLVVRRIPRVHGLFALLSQFSTHHIVPLPVPPI